MHDDETVIFSSSSEKVTSKPLINGLRVVLISPYATDKDEFFFSRDFSIGRSDENDIGISDPSISRKHLDVRKEYDGWYVSDLGSTNGSYLADEPLSKPEKLVFPCVIRFGKTESYLQFYDLNATTPVLQMADASDVTQIVPDNEAIANGGRHKGEASYADIKRRFLDETGVEKGGDYTQMVRAVIKDDRKKKARKYKVVIGFASFLIVSLIGYIVYLNQKIDNARNIAIDMFYDMKAQEVDLAAMEIQVRDATSSPLQQSVVEKREKLRDMQDKYKAYVDELNTFKLNIIPAQNTFVRRIPVIRDMAVDTSYEAELVLRVARTFGECDLELPAGFVDEVKKYIGYWRGSQRMANAMLRLQENDYAPIVIDAMKKENLPVQFLYLSLQESNFNPNAVGPETKYGIAKGAWQFIPSTGEEYGLKPGPLADTREPDPQDDRHDFVKSTYAGAKFLKYMYTMETQASGLLVMAGYNWGPYGVRDKVKRMPDNPRDKNFWRFIQQYTMPEETYNYVFYIFSAAVIGEDPAYFGFDFESPTAGQDGGGKEG